MGPTRLKQRANVALNMVAVTVVHAKEQLKRWCLFGRVRTAGQRGSGRHQSVRPTATNEADGNQGRQIRSGAPLVAAADEIMQPVNLSRLAMMRRRRRARQSREGNISAGEISGKVG